MNLIPWLLTCCLFLKSMEAKKRVAEFDGEGFIPGVITAFESDLHAEGKFGIQYPCRMTGDLEEGCELKVSQHDKWEYICCNGVCDHTRKRFAPLDCPKPSASPRKGEKCYICQGDEFDGPQWCVVAPESNPEAEYQCPDDVPYCLIVSIYGNTTVSKKRAIHRGCSSYPQQGCYATNIRAYCQCDTEFCNDARCQDPRHPFTLVDCRSDNGIYCYGCEANHIRKETVDCKDNPTHAILCGDGQVCRTLSYVSTTAQGSVLRRQCAYSDRKPGHCYKTVKNLPTDASPTNPSCECICEEDNCNKKRYFGAGWNACATSTPPTG